MNDGNGELVSSAAILRDFSDDFLTVEGMYGFSFVDITADPLWIDESTISIGSSLNLIGFYQENSDAELTTGESVKIPVLIATCISNFASDLEFSL